jgi:predicted transcriptional regulator of viral defense system
MKTDFVDLKTVEILIKKDFQEKISEIFFRNEEHVNSLLSSFLELNLPFNTEIAKNVTTKHGNLDILINDRVIIEIKLADYIGTLEKGLSEVVKYKNLGKDILVLILDVGAIEFSIIERYKSYFKQIGAEPIVIKTQGKREKSSKIISYIEDLIANNKFIYVKELSKKSKFNSKSIYKALSRLEKRGVLERLEKGKYLVIPFGAKKGEYTLHEFIIGSILIEPYAIAYWSALNYYGLTEQIPITVFIQTTSRKKKQKNEIFGVKYKIVRIKNEKLFGIKKEWIENTQISITDKEKTIIDCLDKPQYCGGMIEVIKALKNSRKELDFKKLSEYANQIGNSGVTRRLGYVCDLLNIKIKLKPPNVRNYLLLDPTMPSEQIKNAKWRLIVNLDERTIGGL